MKNPFTLHQILGYFMPGFMFIFILFPSSKNFFACVARVSISCGEILNVSLISFNSPPLGLVIFFSFFD